jgi:hypothetical protein
MKNVKKISFQANAAKRLISVLILIFTLCGGFVTANGEESSTDGNALTLLRALGVVDSAGDAQPERQITRGELARVAVRLSGMDLSRDVSTMPYTDVPESSAYAADIYAAYKMNYMRGYGDGTFHPDAGATVEEAATALVRVCGYEISAGNYRIIASNIGIFKGVSDTGALNEKTLYRMAYNALNAKVMLQTGYGANPEYSVSRDLTLLNSAFNVYKGRGAVTADYATGLTLPGGAVTEGRIKIGERVYRAADGIEIFKLFGLDCDFYYEDTEDETPLVIAIFPTGAANVLTVDAEDLLNYADNKLTYEINDKERSAKISKTADIIYNGTAYGELTNAEFLPELGEITLIDNDGDSVYDVVFVYSYQNYYVSYVNALDDSIVDSDSGNVTKSVKFDGEDGRDYAVYNGGVKIAPGDIPKNSIVSVFESKTGYKLAYVSLASVEGELTELSADDRKIAVDGKTYSVINPLKYEAQVGKYGIFYIDSSGKVAYVDFSAAKENLSYGYLIKANKGKGISGGLNLKVLTVSGDITIFKCTEKIELNGKMYKVETDSYDVLWDYGKGDGDNRKVIRYELNEDGDVKALETPIEDSDGAPDDSLRRAVKKDANLMFKSGYLLFANMSTTPITPVNVSNNTVVFIIPADVTKTDDYFTDKPTRFGNDETVPFDGYRTSKSKMINIMVYEGAEKRESKGDSNYMLIERVVSAVNENGDTAYKLTGMVKGKVDASLEVADDAQSVAMAETLRAGDFIIYGVNVRGQLIFQNKMFDGPARISLRDENVGFNYARSVYGEVLDFYDTIITIKGDSNGVIYSYKINCPVFRYSFAKGKTESSSTASFVPGQKVFIRTWEEAAQTAVIYDE